MPTLYGYVSNTPGQFYDDIQQSGLPKEEKVKLINQRAEEYNKQLQREALAGYGRIGLGSLLEGASMHPALNIPYVGTGLGGALYGAGDAIMQGKPIGEIAQGAGQGFLIGETVGAIPYAGKGIAKTKAGQAVGKFGGGVVDKIGQTPIGQKIGHGLGKIEDVLMTDIKAFNPNKQTMYHGSPYDFNKFSNEAIGTGEGAQAHGYGHYAALNKDVAEGYRNKLSTTTPEENLIKQYGKERVINDLQKELNDSLQELQTLQKAKIEQAKVKDFGRKKPIDYDNSIKLVEEEINNLQNRIYNVNNPQISGQLYKLSIPKDDVMLREDGLFTNQSPYVQKQLKQLAKEYDDLFDTNDFTNSIYGSGKQTYNFLQKELGEKNANRELLNRGIKGISYNGGIDGEAAVIFNPDDIDIVRKFYNQPGAMEYLKKINPNIGSEAEAINKGLVDKKYWKQYAKDNFLGKSVNIPGYTDVTFTNKNLGEDYIYNMPEYPTLFDRLTNSKYHFSTNYKREPDRLYDHLLNTENDDLFDYLIEVIKEDDGTMHHNYKMMKNIKKGDKP